MSTEVARTAVALVLAFEQDDTDAIWTLMSGLDREAAHAVLASLSGMFAHVIAILVEFMPEVETAADFLKSYALELAGDAA